MAYVGKRERIEQEVRDAIKQGLYRQDEKLPSARDLALRHKAGISTAQHALDQLKQEGLIEGRKGDGYYLASGPHPRTVEERVDELDDRTGALEAMLLEVREHLGLPRPGETPSDRNATTRRGDTGHGRTDRATGT